MLPSRSERRLRGKKGGQPHDQRNKALECRWYDAWTSRRYLEEREDATCGEDRSNAPQRCLVSQYIIKELSYGLTALGFHSIARWTSRTRKKSPSFFILFLFTTLERCSTIRPIKRVKALAMQLWLLVGQSNSKNTCELLKVLSLLHLPIITP